MSDYIKREDAIKAISNSEPPEARYPFVYIDKINKIPSAELPSKCIATVKIDEGELEKVIDKMIVRCKDCIFNGRGWCGAQEYGTRQVEDNDYCSYGERKDNECK